MAQQETSVRYILAKPAFKALNGAVRVRIRLNRRKWRSNGELETRRKRTARWRASVIILIAISRGMGLHGDCME